MKNIDLLNLKLNLLRLLGGKYKLSYIIYEDFTMNRSFQPRIAIWN